MAVRRIFDLSIHLGKDFESSALVAERPGIDISIIMAIAYTNGMYARAYNATFIVYSLQYFVLLTPGVDLPVNTKAIVKEVEQVDVVRVIEDHLVAKFEIKSPAFFYSHG